MDTFWIWLLVGAVLAFGALLLWRQLAAGTHAAPPARPQPASPSATNADPQTPAAPPETRTAVSIPDIPDVPPPAPGEVWRVLVVDDLPVWANQMRDYGRLFPCEVRHAARLAAAAQELARWRPHLIILDLHMPRDPWQPIDKLQGKYPPDQKTLAFCEQVVTHPKLKHILIIFTSVEEQPEQQARTQQAGAAGFYTKGDFSVSLFGRVLQQAAARQQAAPPLE